MACTGWQWRSERPVLINFEGGASLIPDDWMGGVRERRVKDATRICGLNNRDEWDVNGGEEDSRWRTQEESEAEAPF